MEITTFIIRIINFLLSYFNYSLLEEKFVLNKELEEKYGDL